MPHHLAVPCEISSYILWQCPRGDEEQLRASEGFVRKTLS